MPLSATDAHGAPTVQVTPHRALRRRPRVPQPVHERRDWCEIGASLELGGLLGTTGVVRGGGWSSYKVLACEQGRLPRSGRVRSVYVQSRGETATEMRDETQTATEMRDETRKCPAARRAGPCYGRIDSAN